MNITHANLTNLNATFTLLTDSFNDVKNATQWITKSYLRNKIKHKNCYITIHNNIISSVIIYTVTKRQLAIDLLAVHDKYRNKHIGTNLVKHAKNKAKQNLIEVGSYKKMNSTSFWIKNQFKIKDTYPNEPEPYCVLHYKQD
jgi:N-acetylglutamate synthase-like GNAT family acetyltransferase